MKIVPHQRGFNRILIFLLVALSAFVGAQEPGPRFAYFIGFSGEFLKVDLTHLSVNAYWMLPRVEELGPRLPSFVPPRAKTATGLWLTSALLSDRRLKRLYGLFPRTTDIASENQNGGADEQTLIGLTVPNLTPLAHIDVPASSAVILSKDSSRLFVSYLTILDDSPQRQVKGITEIYDPSDMKKLATLSETVEYSKYTSGSVLINTYFNKGSYISDNGSTIYDGLQRIRVTSTKMTKETIDPLSLMSESQRRELQPYERVDSISNRRYVPWLVADSAAGRSVLMIGGADILDYMILVLDMDNAKIIMMEHCSPSRAHLSPDGTKVILETLAWQKEQQGNQTHLVTNKTGRWIILDSVSGKQLLELSSSELAGSEEDHTLLCTAPDFSVMFYASGSRLIAIRAAATSDKVASVMSDFTASRWTLCAYTDR